MPSQQYLTAPQQQQLQNQFSQQTPGFRSASGYLDGDTFGGGNSGSQLLAADAEKANEELTALERRNRRNEKRSAAWLQASRHALERDYQKAYGSALRDLDDMYLLQLVVQTGPVLSQGLTDGTSKEVLRKLNKLNKASVFYKIQVDWLEEAFRTNSFRHLSYKEQKEYLQTLQLMANSKNDLIKKDLRQRAHDVYTNLKT